MKRLLVLSVFIFAGLNLYAQFQPDQLKWKFLDSMPLREYNEWAGNRTTCSREFRTAFSSITSDSFDIHEFFQITDIYGNEMKEDDQFWEYILANYEKILNATLTAGDVNIFFAPVYYFGKEDITDGYFLISRYNGGQKNDANSYRLFLYYFQVQWF